MNPNFLIAIVGPTATGKSSLALNLAIEFKGEIVNCDSMQVYRGLDIGTGKPPLSERTLIKHHLIDIVEPKEVFSAGMYKILADTALSEVWKRRNIPFLVGGTGLYYRYILKSPFPAPPSFSLLREALSELAEKNGLNHLYNILLKIDPESKNHITSKDSLRIIRALEIFLVTNRTKSDLMAETPFGTDRFRSIKIGLTLPRKILYNRIEERIDKMISSGWLNEVKRLSNEGRLVGQAEKAIGYKELAQCAKGMITMCEAIRLIKARTNHFAKRQITWFKKEDGIIWLDGSEDNIHDKARDIIINAMEGRDVKRD